MNFAQIGQVGTPVATDCKGTTESVTKFTYATFLADGTPDMTIADVEPTNGRLCAGTWNRNTGGGIPDFTTCNPTNKSGTVFVVASGSGASSNPLPIYVHPVRDECCAGSIVKRLSERSGNQLQSSCICHTTGKLHYHGKRLLRAAADSTDGTHYNWVYLPVGDQPTGGACL